MFFQAQTGNNFPTNSPPWLDPWGSIMDSDQVAHLKKVNDGRLAKITGNFQKAKDNISNTALFKFLDQEVPLSDVTLKPKSALNSEEIFRRRKMEMAGEIPVTDGPINGPQIANNNSMPLEHQKPLGVSNPSFSLIRPDNLAPEVIEAKKTPKSFSVVPEDIQMNTNNITSAPLQNQPLGNQENNVVQTVNTRQSGPIDNFRSYANGLSEDMLRETMLANYGQGIKDRNGSIDTDRARINDLQNQLKERGFNPSKLLPSLAYAKDLIFGGNSAQAAQMIADQNNPENEIKRLENRIANNSNANNSAEMQILSYMDKNRMNNENLNFRKQQLDLQRQGLMARLKGNNGDKPKELNGEQLKRLDNAKMALKAIHGMREALGEGESTFSILGDNNFTIWERNFSEAIGRMQSGGAINKDEEARFVKMAPKFWDSPEIREKKLKELEAEMADRISTLGRDPSNVVKRDTTMDDLDQKALVWAKENSNDPRATRILQELGL